MQAQQLQTIRAVVDAVAANDIDKAASHLSDSDEFSWDLRPATVKEYMGFGAEEKLSKPQMVKIWKKIRSEVIKEVKSIKLQNIVQGQDALALRILNEPTTVDGQTFKNEIAVFVDFEPGTDKVLKGVESFDSARLIEHLQRLNVKLT
ncbi:hypothetical protein JCM1840_002879 [Sporobolomyces johnsonii]